MVWRKLKRVVFRSRFYYAIGISIIGLPITFLGFSRNLYNLIDNVSLLNFLFPTFRHFLLIGGLSLIPFCMGTGYLFIKSPFYREERRAPAENNPFNFRLAPGRDSVLYSGSLIGQNNMLRLFKKFETITEEESAEFEKYLDLMKILSQGGSLRK